MGWDYRRSGAGVAAAVCLQLTALRLTSCIRYKYPIYDVSGSLQTGIMMHKGYLKITKHEIAYRHGNAHQSYKKAAGHTGSLCIAIRQSN